MRMLPTAFVIAALALSAGSARAQFTAAIVPPKPVMRPDSLARRDSVQQAMRDMSRRLEAMQRWVDSAAGALAIDTLDSAPPAASSAPDAHAAPAKSEDDTIFRPGASAPYTVSELPLLAVVGAGTLLVGVALLRR